MEEEGGGLRLSKRFSDKDGEVDYKTKAGTAWSHSFLNQKPWHPLSYPNQRRKWIAEQTHAQRDRRAQELAHEYAQEQDFLRQTSLLSDKEKEKVDMMQAVSFMYVRPPGYNAESAKAADVAEERKKVGESDPNAGSSSSMPQAVAPVKEEKKKSRAKDIYGRTLPTEEEFAVLKNAPRLETGVQGRPKPFAVEVRNVKCVRCGTFGHQSGDRECPLRDVIMPNDESRLKRDDPLTAIVAHMDSSEPLKWELKQKPGISPPRGGFMEDDPNQQIVAEDIFDEYGGFLGGEGIPELLTNFSSKKHKKKSKSESKHKKKQVSSRRNHEDADSTSYSDDDRRNSKSKKLKSKGKHKKRASTMQSDEENDSSENDKRGRFSEKNKHSHMINRKKKTVSSHFSMSEDSDNGSTSSSDGHQRKKEHRHRTNKGVPHSSSDDSVNGTHHGKSKHEYRDSDKHKNHTLPKHRESRVHDKETAPDSDKKSSKHSYHYEYRDSDKYKNHPLPKHRESRVHDNYTAVDSDTKSSKHSHQYHYRDSVKHKNRTLSKHRESRVHNKDSASDSDRKSRKHSRHYEYQDSDKYKNHSLPKHRSKKTARNDSDLSSSQSSEFERHKDKRKHKRSHSSNKDSGSDDHQGRRRHRHHHL